MKHRSIAVIAVAVAVALTFAFAGLAVAEDVLLEVKVESITFAQGRNNSGEYARIIFEEPRTVGGVTYTADAVLMCFRNMVAEAKKISDGDTIRLIAQKQQYQGRDSYVALKFLDMKPTAASVVTPVAPAKR